MSASLQSLKDSVMTKLLSLAGLVPSNEGIEFQNGAFFKQLVLVLDQHHQDIRRSLTGADFGKLGIALDVVVKKFTGLKTDVTWEEFDMNAYVATPIVDANSPIFQAIHQYYEPGTTGTDYFVQKKGSAFNLDPKTGRVSGTITEEKFTVGMPAITYRNGRLTSEELAATLLHELGHIFSMLECLDKTCSSNAVLTELDQRLRSGLEPKERAVVLEKAGKALGFERDVIEDATKTNNDKVALTIYIGNTLRNIRTSSGDSFFDINTWETLADQYAARHGAGKALVTGLDKGHTGNVSDRDIKSGISYFLFEVLKVMRMVLMLGNGLPATVLSGGGLAGVLIGATSLAAGGLPFLLYGALAAIIGLAAIITTPSGDGTYAAPLERLTRVRQQLVEQIKRMQVKTAPRSVQQQLLADIATIDEVLAAYKQSSDWFNTVAGFLSSSFKNRHASAKFQKELESLAMNDLFVKSLELKV